MLLAIGRQLWVGIVAGNERRRINVALFWIEVNGTDLTSLETGETVRLFSDPPDAAYTLTRMVPDAVYDGAVILVTGKAKGKDIYHAQIRGALDQRE